MDIQRCKNVLDKDNLECNSFGTRFKDIPTENQKHRFKIGTTS
jgi:hypothetical protein